MLESTTRCGHAHSIPRSAQPPRSLAQFLLSAALLASAGCADWRYDEIRLRAVPREYATILAADRTRQTPLGLAHLDQRSAERPEALLVVLSNDRRVAGKLQVRRSRRMTLSGAREIYQLRGEIDAALIGAAEAGPVDALRLLLSELERLPREPLPRNVYGSIAAGLVRLLDRWPGATAPEVDRDALDEWLCEINPEGQADISTTQGVIRIHYTAEGSAPAAPTAEAPTTP